MLDIEKVINNPNYRVVISTPAGVVKGYVSDDFSFGMTSQYSSPFEEQASQSQFSDVINKYGITGINTLLGKDISQVQLKSFAQTVALWQGSDKPEFSITVYFIAQTQEDDVSKPIKVLLKGVVPEGTLQDKFMKAPYGYSPKLENTAPRGTVSLRIGKWFEAHGLLITSVQSQFSAVVMPNGKPLYSQATVSLTPFRLPDYRMVASWFK